MVAAIIAWVVSLGLVAVFASDFLSRRVRHRKVELGLLAPATLDPEMARLTESAAGQLREKRGAEQLGPGGLGG